MKTYYTIEGRELRTGDVIGGKEITIHNGLLWVDGVPVSQSWRIHHLVQKTSVPRCVAFNRKSGQRLMPYERLTDGRAFVGSREAGVLVSDSHNYVLTKPRSRPEFESGIEIRVNPSLSEYLYGLPRNDDGTVTGIRGRRIPAAEAVWTGRCYRHVDEFVVCVDNSMVRKSAVPPSWVTAVCGTVGPKGSFIELHDGRFALPHEALFVGGGWRIRSELTLCVDEDRNERWVLEVPEEGYVRLNDGRYIHSTQVGICSHSFEVCYRVEMRRLSDGRRVSRTVEENECVTCGDCDRSFLPEAGEEVCASCRAGSRSRIHYYSDDRANYLRPEKDVPIKFGIELEIGCDRGTSRVRCAELMADAFDSASGNVTDYCAFKNDGSLEECDGFEIVTRPDCPSVHKRIFSAALRDPRIHGKMSSFDNGFCGMHIHVSRAPLNELWVGRMLVMINSSDMKSVVTAAAMRSANRYTTFDPNKKLTSTSDNRYEALNTTGSRTVEFRIFRGTMNPESFIRNIEFVESVIAFTRPATRSLKDIGDRGRYLAFLSGKRKEYPRVFDLMERKGFYA